MGALERHPRALTLATLTLTVLITLLTPPAHAQLGTTPAALALQLALENNVQASTYADRCNAFGAEQRTLIGVVPINRQVLTAAVAYRAELHALDAAATQDLLDRSTARYLHGDEAVFLLFVVNPNPMDPEALVLLSADDIRLQDEYRRRYEPLRSTPVFDGNRPLGPGTTHGYLYYPNFRPAGGASYAVQFDSGYVRLCPNGEDRYVYMALGFDESELDFFDLFRRGIDPEALRRDYRIPTYGEAGLTSPDFLDLLSLVINLIGLIR
jgi:hypothetical protein